MLNKEIQYTPGADSLNDNQFTVFSYLRRTSKVNDQLDANKSFIFNERKKAIDEENKAENKTKITGHMFQFKVWK